MQEAVWDPQRALVAPTPSQPEGAFYPETVKSRPGPFHMEEKGRAVGWGGRGGLILVIKMLTHYLRRQTFGFHEKDSKMKRFLFKLPKSWRKTAKASN